MPDDIFGLIVTLNVKPECMKPLLAMMHEVHARMRLEPTFVNATLHVGQDDPNQIVVHETWRDRRDFDEVQMHRDYRTEYARCMPDMVRTPREMRFYTIERSDFAFPND